MRAHLYTQSDFDSEVIDIILAIEEDDGPKRLSWIKGYEDDEWEEAEKYALELAKTLNIEYVGEISEN